MNYPTFEITENDNGIRSAGEPDACFYCQMSVGDNHIFGCVITWRSKKVKLEAIIEFEQDVPEHWTDENILFRYNEGTWCASNLVDIFADNDCGCGRTSVVIKENI
jgi:hypothetical protein